MSADRPVVLITGGTRGIGAATAEECLRRGYRVCCTHTGDRQPTWPRGVDAVSAADAMVIEADATSEDDMARAWDAATGMGRVVGLVNNAGITGPLGRFADVDIADVRRVLDVNLVGAIIGCRLAVTAWGEDPGGRSIVNVSSVAATLGAPGEYIPYAAAKAGVETLTVGLAKELGPTGLRVNAVAPGTTETDIHAAAGDPDRPARVAARIPLGRVASPAEVARAIAWLLSPDASYVTGAVLRVTGGL